MTHPPAHMLPVYRSTAFCVKQGANLGDAVSFAAELALDDVYALHPSATLRRLGLQPQAQGYCVAPDGDLGREGAALHLDCALTLMSPDG